MMSGAFWVRVGAVLGFLAVAAGAFGAHVLQERFQFEPRMIETFETGVRYQMIHALVIVVVGVLMMLEGAVSKPLRIATWSFLVGVMLFSGSLYGLSTGIGPRGLLGPLTPLGGVSLLVGWLALAIAPMRRGAGEP